MILKKKKTKTKVVRISKKTKYEVLLFHDSNEVSCVVGNDLRSDSFGRSDSSNKRRSGGVFRLED